MLQALEEDKFNQLPGGIFNKGFVRAYSRFLGLDEDQTVAEYLQASGDAPPVSTEIAAREDGARENEENISRLEAISDAHPRQLPWGLFAALLLLVALALSLWSHRQRERAREALHPTPTTAVMPLPAAQSSTEASGKISNENNASSSPTNGSTTNGQTIVRRREDRPPPPKQLRTKRFLFPPRRRASLRSSFKPARNPGSRSQPTAKLRRPKSWRQAASVPSTAEKKSPLRPGMPVALTFASTERSSILEANSGRSRPLLSALADW